MQMDLSQAESESFPTWPVLLGLWIRWRHRRWMKLSGARSYRISGVFALK